MWVTNKATKVVNQWESSYHGVGTGTEADLGVQCDFRNAKRTGRDGVVRTTECASDSVPNLREQDNGPFSKIGCHCKGN